MTNCLYCGSPLPKPSHGVQKYCTPECKRLARNKRVRDRRIPVWPHEIRKCRECGKEFLARRISTIFCSHKCHVKYHSRKPKNRAITCLICGKEFVATNKGPALYCSDECRKIAKRKYYDNYHIRLHKCATPGCTHKTKRKYCCYCREKMK